MKKLAIVLSVAAAGVLTALGQGQVQFQNSSSFPIRVTDLQNTQVVGTASSMVHQGEVRVQLWMGTNGAPVSSMVAVGFVTNSTSSAAGAQGFFNGGNPYTLPAPFDGTFPVELFIRVWTINTGALDYQSASTAQGGYIGQSPLLTNFQPGTALGQPTPIFGTGAGQLQGLLLVPVPEPGTIALAGLGAAALLLFRRRK